MDYSISIILCCYNSEKFLNETLNSIKNQTYTNYELIIVDDGSKDTTLEILERFIEQNQTIKIKLIKQPNMGLPKARNIALINSTNEYIAIIDHDDLWVKNKLSVQVNHIKKNKDCHLFFSDFEYLNFIKKNNTRFQTSKLKDNFIPHKLNLTKNHAFVNLSLFGCFIGSSTVVFKKEVVNCIGNFDENYLFLTDYIFFLKLSKKYNIFCSPLVLSKWRYHNNNATVKLNRIYIKEMKNLYSILLRDSNFNLIQKFKILKLSLKFIIKNILL